METLTLRIFDRTRDYQVPSDLVDLVIHASVMTEFGPRYERSVAETLVDLLHAPTDTVWARDLAVLVEKYYPRYYA